MERPNKMAYPSHGHLLAPAVPLRQPVLDDQRGEGQADEGGDAVADRQAEGGLGTDLLDRADEHAAGAGDGIVHLAAGGDDVEHLGAHLVPVVRVLALELAEGRGVEVELLHPDADLVGPQLGAGVEPLGGLREHDRVVEDPVQASGIAGRVAEHPLVLRHSVTDTGDIAARHWTCRIISSYRVR